MVVPTLATAHSSPPGPGASQSSVSQTKEALAAADQPRAVEAAGSAGQWMVRQLPEAERAAWDALVAANPASGFMQSWSWAEFKAREGYQTWPLGVYVAGELIAGAIVQAYPAHGGGALLFAPGGPVLPWGEPDLAREALRHLLDATRPLAAEVGALALRIEPYLPPPRPALLREFARAPIDLYPAQTLVLDLVQDEDAILAAMKPKGRYNIRLAARRGVTVEVTDSLQALRRFYALFAQTARRDGFFAEPFGFFINLVGALAPAGMVRLYFATHDGVDLATAIVVHFGPRAVYLYGATADVGRNLMASYAVQWAIVRDSRAAGLREYDFYGFEPHGLTDHLYAGFSRFKRQFGGTVRRFIGAHDYFYYDSLADRLVAALRSLDNTERVGTGTDE